MDAALGAAAEDAQRTRDRRGDGSPRLLRRWWTTAGEVSQGFDVAVVQLDVDEIGFGKGSMAPAARIKAGEPTGIQIEDYAGQPVPLVSVRKVIS